MLLRLILFCSLTFSVQALDWPTNDLNAVEYYLYVGDQEPFIFKIDVDPVELLNHGFNPEYPTKIFAHGYVDHAITYTPPLNEAYNNDPEEHYNVIGIEWYRLANIYNYIEAATNTNRVGAHVGSNLVSKIFMDVLGQTSDQIHAIGHSLGAHLVGHLGRAVQAEGKDPIKRVTALDPAKPFFDIVSLDYRVQPTDAVLVDVIHTNSGDLWDSALSMPWVVGDVDFFPNGGEHQPGCTEACIGTACLDIPLIDMFNGACSHMRAIDVFIDSVANRKNPSYFESLACSSFESYQAGECLENSKIPMGEQLSTEMLDGTSHAFYLETTDQVPFSLT